jgi:multidrug resistance protein MdtO
VATLAQSVREPQQRWGWFWEFLKDELLPYPGRAGTVARMVIAATLIMIVCMTFRVPYAFQGAIYALLISRESPRATLQSSWTLFFVTGIGAVYLLASVWFVISIPVLHFLWIIGSLFLTFYTISVLRDYTTAVAFANVISVGIPLWDRHVSAETNVEDTLWLCLAVVIAVVITGAVELAFARLQPGDELVLPIAERLSAVSNVLMSYAEHRALDPAAEQKVIRLEVVGTSMLRRILRRSGYAQRYTANMGGVAALTGRLVDLAATLTQLDFEISEGAQRRFGDLASTIATIREQLIRRELPDPVQFGPDEQSAAAVPLLSEMEHTVTLIPQVFADSRSDQQRLPSAGDLPVPSLLLPDAFVNPDHLRFALRGCLAASSCYVIYNAMDWPGISTSVTTCLLTALSTIGASRQKQVLRLTGAAMGGFVFGMGSQMFILPYLNSIGGFTMLFIFVTAFSGWVMTSSTRLSYFGLQVALAYYLINLQEFAIVTSLALARDRVVGVLLGLFLMWLVFDRIWSAPAGVQMRTAFITSLRLLAQLAREPVSADFRVAVRTGFALRERINAQFDQARSLADSVLFEFGPSRRRDLEIRKRIRHWQPELRALFLMRVASMKYRLQLPGFELPEAVRVYQREYDEHSAQMLEQLADFIEGKQEDLTLTADQATEILGRVLDQCFGPEAQALPAAQVESFVTLLRQIDRLTRTLSQEIAREFRPA